MKKILVGVLWLWSFFSYAQEFKPVGFFSKDTLKIGEPVRFTLSFRHKPDWEVFFPDSAYNFMPFEYQKHDFFPTKTQDGVSIDSAVYVLSAFSEDSLIEFSMPVFVIEKGDTSLYLSEKQSIFIQHLVKQLPDSVQLLTDTEFRYVQKKINYIYVALFIIVLVILLAVFWVIFGNQIRRAYKLNRMKKQWLRFSNEFERLSNNPLDVPTIEKSLLLWKSYLESLQNIPFTSYTSKEIEQSIGNESLSISLKNIDRAIYGNIFDEQLRLAMQALGTYALESYEQKVKEVRNV